VPREEIIIWKTYGIQICGTNPKRRKWRVFMGHILDHKSDLGFWQGSGD
jgi:hypothetical protein